MCQQGSKSCRTSGGDVSNNLTVCFAKILQLNPLLLLSRLPLTHAVTHDTILSVISSVRKSVEFEENGSRFRFDAFLLPEEGQEASVLAEGGLTNREIDPILKGLIDETRDFLER